MASWLGDLLIRLRADTADFQSDMGKAAHQADRTAKQIRGALEAIGVGLSIHAMGKLVEDAIEAADAIGKLSQKVGFSTEALSGLQLAAQLSDVSIESFGKGLKNFNLALIEAQDQSSKASRLFKAMGIDINAGPEKALRQFADVISKMPDGALKTAAAVEIFKKSGAEMIPMLNMGAAGFAEMQEKAEKLGIVISKDLAKKAEEFNDTLKLLKLSSSALGLAIAEQLLPPLTRIVTEMQKAKESGGAWAGIMQGLGRYLFEVFDGVDDPIQRAARDVVKLEEKILSLQNSLHKVRGPGPTADVKRAIDAEMVKLTQAREWLAKLEAGKAADEKLKALQKGKTGEKTEGKPDLNAINAALAKDTENKAYIAALQSLQEKLGGVNKETEYQVVLNRVLTGTWKDLSEPHKQNLLNVAKEIDLRNATLQVIDSNIARIKELAAVTESLNAIKREAIVTDTASIDQLAFETSLIGKSADAIEKARAARQIELDLRRRLLAIGEASPEDSDSAARAASDAIAQAARTTDAVIAGINARIAAERDWITGTKTATNDYLRDAMNAAEQSRNMFTSAFKAMEDALVEFAKTGKLNFKSLADSIVSDLIRIKIQRDVMGPLIGTADKPGIFTEALGSLSKSILGSILPGRASGGPVSAGTPYLIGEEGPEIMVPGMSGSIIPNDSIGAAVGTPIGGKSVDVSGTVSVNASRRSTVVSAQQTSTKNTFYVDMRGASVEAVARLERVVTQVNGSIERRAIRAVAEARSR